MEAKLARYLIGSIVSIIIVFGLFVLFYVAFTSIVPKEVPKITQALPKILGPALGSPIPSVLQKVAVLSSKSKLLTLPLDINKLFNHPHTNKLIVVRSYQSAWVVEIGIFKQKDNAKIFVNKLRTAGYHAFLKVDNSSPLNVITKVYVGPTHHLKTAQVLLHQLEHVTHSDGIIINYNQAQYLKMVQSQDDHS